MRIPGFLLLLIAAVAALAWPRVERHFPVPAYAGSDHESANSVARTPGVWRYPDSAPFYDVLPQDVQAFESADPDVTAGHVCAALGGETGLVEPARPGVNETGFVCRFVEPDVTMSVDFGDLHRIPPN